MVWVMRIFSRSTIEEFIKRHPETKNALRTWYQDMEGIIIRSPKDVLREFPTARTIWKRRVIFKILWNKYRMIAEIKYVFGIVFINFIWTHAEYDTIDPFTIVH